MKLSTKTFMAVLLSLCSAAVTMAQTKPASLSDLLKVAIAENPSIQVSELEEENVEQQIVETRAKTLPQINGSGNATNNYKRQVLVLPGGLGGGSSDSPTKITAGTMYGSAVAVDASQPVFDMAAFTGLKASRAGREYAELNTKQSKEQVIHDVSAQYYEVLSSMEEVRLQRQSTAILEQLITASEGQYKSGLLKKVDLDRMHVNLINTRSRLTQAENDVALKMNKLKVIMGIPLATALQLDTVNIDDVKIPTLEDAGVSQMGSRTELQSLDAQIRLSTLQRNAIRAENYPKLNLYFNYSYNVMGNTMGEVLTGQNQAITYGMGSWGLRLQVPIFSGLSRHSRAAQSEIKIRQLHKQRAAKELELDASLESANIQMRNTLTTIRAQQENVSLSEQVYNANLANYNLGLSSLTDLLDSQTAFLEARNIYVKSMLNYKLAELETMRASGTLMQMIQ
ncbi:TolC family protein [Chryseolinea sp. T2]|uniref:TolC family protein n=1 Tax=Chryseolinea sp. T2 TaxID=3129255 RepID=UPI0030778A81